MKNGGLLNRIFNVDRGNEENEDDRYFLERSFLLDRSGGGGLHFFLFSFHGKSLTIFEEKEREREGDYLGIFSRMAFVLEWEELGWIFAA